MLSVYAGTNVYFHCKCKFPSIGSTYYRYEPRRNIQMKWTLPNGEQADNRSPALSGRAYAFYNGTLVVRRIQDTDRGVYVCLSKDIHQRVIRTEVTVGVIATLPSLRQRLYQTVRVHLGRPATVDCSAVGHPKPQISWRLPDGRSLSIGARSRSYAVDFSGRLIVKRAHMDNIGKYVCVARNSRGQVERTVQIKPFYTRPRIVKSPRRWIGVRSGNSVRLPCTAVGFPKPKIRWSTPQLGHMRQNQVVRDSYGNRVAIYDSGTLVIHRATKSDTGYYTCTATNYKGNKRIRLRLTVY